MYRRIASAPDPATASLIQICLQASGVTVLECQSTQHAGFAGCDTCYYVEVAEDDFERAVTVLNEEGYGKWLLS